MNIVDMIIVFLAFALVLSTFVAYEGDADDVLIAGDLEEQDG